MHNHAPANYICPICLGAQGIEADTTLIHQSDILYKDDVVMAFIASYFIGKNEGHIIVVPVEHYENFYDLPDEVGARIFALARKMSIAMRHAYDCDGVTTQQNNEPAGGQHAFHYHLHLFPRYEGDNIYEHMSKKRLTTKEDRQSFVEKMKRALE